MSLALTSASASGQPWFPHRMMAPPPPLAAPHQSSPPQRAAIHTVIRADTTRSAAPAARQTNTPPKNVRPPRSARDHADTRSTDITRRSGFPVASGFPPGSRRNEMTRAWSRNRPPSLWIATTTNTHNLYRRHIIAHPKATPSQPPLIPSFVTLQGVTLNVNDTALTIARNGAAVEAGQLAVGAKGQRGDG